MPRRTFDDVVLPAGTRHALAHALSLIKNHDLIFRQWGLAERHGARQGLAFHFAGPPGTGKTICAEAIAQALGKALLVVRYSEMESMWAGQTAKHVAEVFASAARQEAVLFFDEADAIAGRRFTSMSMGYEREANAVVNVLLHEVDRYPGVVIFATNLAANIDPAFERRILTHILFEMPDAEERERIWRVQLHPVKTPLADDVDFAVLARTFAGSGGDIRNAVLKAAQIASAQAGPDVAKRIHQRHFEQGMQEVLAAASVMSQSLYGASPDGPTDPALTALSQLTDSQDALQGQVVGLEGRLGGLERAVDRLGDALDESLGRSDAVGPVLVRLEDELRTLRPRAHRATLAAAGAVIAALAALVLALLR